jgi:hypothetical protein
MRDVPLSAEVNWTSERERQRLRSLDRESRGSGLN